MAGIDEVKVHISASVDEADRALLAIRGVSERLDEVLNRLRLVMAGSAHVRAAEAIAAIEAAQSSLGDAQTQVSLGIQAAQSYHGLI